MECVQEKISDDWSNEAGALPLDANDFSSLYFALWCLGWNYYNLDVNVTPSSCKLDFMEIKLQVPMEV